MMQRKKICIIGFGTFGSYLVKRLIHLYGKNIEITIIEIGNQNIKSEKEIGIRSQSENSNVASSGRYFGLGGTSSRWGGQILFFDERDNINEDPTWNEIIRINNIHRQKVEFQLLGKSFRKRFPEKRNSFKEGIWMRYRKRNLYRQLQKKETAQVKTLQNLRVIDFVMEDSQIHAIICRDINGVTKYIPADIFYLTAGAIESCRLLLILAEKYDVLRHSDLGKNFGDHLSVELFRIRNSKPEINHTNLVPHLYKDSLLTKRIVVYSKSGRTGYLHPIFNKDIKAFTILKGLLFGKQKAKIVLKDVYEGMGFLLKFFFNIFLLKRFYVHKNNWSLQLDIEQSFPNENRLELAEELDSFYERMIRIVWKISEEDRRVIKEIKEQVNQFLEKSSLIYTPVYEHDLTMNKIEDIYHPVGCIRIGNDDKAVINFRNQVKGINNLYHFSTGIFPSAKSINPTAAVLCFIEHHIDQFEYLVNKPYKKGKLKYNLAGSPL